MDTNNFINFIYHRQKFKPVLNEISQLDVSDTLKYKYIFKENSEQLYFKNLNFKNFHTDSKFNWDQLEVMKNLNNKPELYLSNLNYDPFYLWNILDINYILHNIIEYNLLQVGMTNIFLISVSLKYMHIIKLKILNFLDFFEKNSYTIQIIFTIVICAYIGPVPIAEFLKRYYIESKLLMSNIILVSLYFILLDGLLKIIKLLNRIIDILDNK
jgi:hypothetical protein